MIGRHQVVLAQGERYGAVQKPGDLFLFLEADLLLRWVDVDIHLGGIDADVEHDDGETLRHEKAVVGLLDGETELPRADGAAVDHEVLPAAILAAGFGATHVAADANAIAFVVDLDHAPLNARPEKLLGPLPHGLTGGEIEPGLAVAKAGDGDFGVAQGLLGENLSEDIELGRRAFQKLESGGGVVKQVAHVNRGPLGGADRLDEFDASARGDQTGAREIAGSAGEHFEARDGNDRGQGLAPKPARLEREKIVELANLACAVAQNGAAGVGLVHATAIVGHGNGTAVEADLDANAPRAGVKRVVDEFLDHGSGANNNLAGGDFVDEGLRQNQNVGTHATVLAEC